MPLMDFGVTFDLGSTRLVLPERRDLYYGGAWHEPLEHGYAHLTNPADDAPLHGDARTMTQRMPATRRGARREGSNMNTSRVAKKALGQTCRWRCSSTATSGWTNSDTLPPRTAISRTRVEEMNVYCSCGVMNTDSISDD